MFNKILIANRGEIACRVIRTAREMGIQCVTVYSEADSNAMHVDMADEAYCIGPAPSAESYLMGETIIATAKKSGAQAIHPGYGFLAENPEFNRMCEDAGIIFIGPPADAVKSMGSKSEAREIMDKAGVPVVPGYHGDDQDPAVLKSEADKIGYPVLIKPSAGGGGKGMIVVNSADEFDEALEASKRVAISSFGDDRMILENFLLKPRHVEVQVFADTHGNAIYLADRDCSVQRRHQKIIEEAPAPGISDEIRKAMGETAVRAAQAIGYFNAGTVEFLYDEDGSYYFMEMNTRLQVEHPVTEMITGLDLVKWQLVVASGNPLPLKQDEVETNGASIEVRVYAEDPENDFLPATGDLVYLRTPQENGYVRLDTGVRENDTVSVYYDPMIAKLVVWDENRDRAIQRLDQALQDYHISGVKTNLEFLSNVIISEPFGKAEIETNFIQNHKGILFPDEKTSDSNAPYLAALYVLLKYSQENFESGRKSAEPNSPWNIFSSFRHNIPSEFNVKLLRGEEEYNVSAVWTSGGFKMSMGETSVNVTGELSCDELVAYIDERRMSVEVAGIGNEITIYNGRLVTTFVYIDGQDSDHSEEQEDAGLTAPMNGTIVNVLVKPGTIVKKGDTLIILEAMKMEHSVSAPDDGTVTEVFFQTGDLVKEGTELLAFEPEAAEQEG